MIIGDKIVTVNVQLGRALVPVEVCAIEKGDIVWKYERTTEFQKRLYIAHCVVLVDGGFLGRVAKRDRGLTWAPTWIESEVDMLRVVAGLMTWLGEDGA